MLRKVMVSKWIWRPTSGPPSSWEEAGEALFHGFGSDHEEGETGFGNFSVAIVEWPTGQVELVRADKIRFLNPIITGVDKSNGGDRTAVVHVSREDGRVVVHGEEFEA